jgi:hypothetical protein
MKQSIAVAGCSTISAELAQCCRQLGLPVKLYASRPACLFGVAREEFDALLTRAATETDDLLVALAHCCGEFEVGGADRVAAARCTEMLLGSGTYTWLAEHGALTLPPPYFSTWLKHPGARAAVAEVLASPPELSAVESIAAVDNPERGADPEGLAEIERLSGRPSRRVTTGLGHLREHLRRVAAAVGLEPGRSEPQPLAPAQLGPGDDCLILQSDPALAWDAAVEVVAQSVAQGVRCVWVTDGGAAGPLVDRLLVAAPALREALDSGCLRVVEPPNLLATANAETDPQLLVAHWVRLATEALAAGDSGLCLIHSGGWSDAVGLPSEWVLAYASRLSAACARWPISGFCEFSPAADAALLGELPRIHPLLWQNGLVHVSAEFVDSDEYLGGEDLLQALGRERITFTCAQAQPLLSALTDGELDGPAAVALAQHAQDCPDCGQRLQQHRDTKRSLATLRLSVEGVADELWARICQELHDGG